jgi:glycosyltransferase involved in cell wall biosynthesis
VRVLLSSYVCNPTMGSEAGVGWALARAAAQRHDVTLLTQSLERHDIEQALADDAVLAAHLHVVYLDVPGSAPRRGGHGTRLHHHRWQRRVTHVGRELHRQQPFDVGHHAAFATDSGLAGVTAIDPHLPTVWGPVGGATSLAPSLWRHLGPRGALEEAIRATRGACLRKIFGEGNARRAALTVAANDTTRRRFARHGAIVVEPTAMLDALPFELHPHITKSEAPLRAVFAGRLLAWKGPALAIAALAQVDDWYLDIFGEGPEEARCRALAAKLGVENRVSFWGEVPRDELLKHLAEADALLFPSLREQTGWVVAEAIAVGTPVVCVDRGGPPALVRGTDVGSGVVVPPGRHLIRRLAEALEQSRELHRVPSDRWSIDRMPDTLDHWYALARSESEKRNVSVAKSPSRASSMSASANELPIGADEVAAFERDGFVVMDRPVISDAGIDEARQLIEHALSHLEKAPQIYVNDMGQSVGFSGKQPSLMPNLLFCADLERGLRSTEAFTTCRRVAEQLLGGPVHYEFDQVILKAPQSDVVTPWHTDLAYKRHPESCPEAVDFWISMQDTTVDMGAMRYIPGTHRQEIEHERIGGPEGRLIRALDLDESAAVDGPLRKGGVGIHHLRTVHGAGPNTTDRARLAWVVHFSREDRGPVRRWAEDRLSVDTYFRLAAARAMPVFGPVMAWVERLLLRRPSTV